MAEESVKINEDLTIPQLFLSQCRKYGNKKVAM